MATENPIVLENQLPGTPQSVWGLSGPASTNIEGFTTDISVNHGTTIDFKINTDSSNYSIEIYRLGYYGGDGARLVDTIQHQSGSSVVQPDPLHDATTGLVDAGNWQITDSWAIPADAVSGVYLAKLVRQDGTFGENQIPFVVRDDGGQSDIMFQTSDSTWQAYNPWGGRALYNLPVFPGDSDDVPPPDAPLAATAAYAVSYNRPFANESIGLGENFLWGSEYPALFWLEENGYDVSYITDVDTARNGSELLNHKVFLSVGHDEYWSAEQRANVEAARNAGVNLEFWGGNDVFWKTEWAPSIDPTETSFRTVITYKETQNHVSNPSGVWTGTWGDPTQPDGANPQNSLTGTMFAVNGGLGTIQVPNEYTQMKFWRNTAVANTAPGQTAILVPNGLGTEWDSDLDNGFRPAGQIDLSFGSYTYDYAAVISDFSTNISEPGTATNSMTLYRADSGALVFSAGNQFFTWDLDSHHDVGRWGDTHPPDPNIQQAMVNLFGDMGVQPATLRSSLVPALASTDFVAPTTMPSELDALVSGQDITFSLAGSASDQGGVVAGVEASFDGGASWHPASGRSAWSYSFTTTTPTNLSVRAIDDSVNIGSSYLIPQSVIDVAIFDSVSGGGKASALAYTDQVRDEAVIVWNNYTVTGQWDVQSIRFNDGESDVAYFDQVDGKNATVWNIYDSLGNWGQQTLDFADLTREIAQLDWASQQPWSQVWDHYDALGNWDQQTLYYDDGTTDIVQIDWANQQPWSQVWDHYDALGNWDQQTLHYDDATTDIVRIDWANQQPWSQVWDHYDALGNWDQQTVLYDDKTRLSATLDAYNLQPWYSDNSLFDASNTLVSRYQVMDDGTIQQLTAPSA